MLNTYELAVLYDPQLEVDLSKAEAKTEKLVGENKGKITKTDNWGKRKLAYKINKQENAIYVFYTLELPPKNVASVEKSLNITDEIIRFLIIRPDLKAIAKADARRAEKAKKQADYKTSESKDEDEDDTIKEAKREA